MRIAVNTQAAPVSSEKTLLERLQRLSRRAEGKVLLRILIEDAQHQPRLSIETFTPSEEAGIRRLVEDLGFRDRAPKSGLDTDSANGTLRQDGGKAFAHDVFDVVYRFMG